MTFWGDLTKMSWDRQTSNQIKRYFVPKKLNSGDRMIHVIPSRFPRTWMSWSVPHACLLKIYLSLFPALVYQIMSRLSLSPLQSCRTVTDPSSSALRVCLVRPFPLVFSESKSKMILITGRLFHDDKMLTSAQCCSQDSDRLQDYYDY